jgi:hypothetical protein
MRILAVQCQLLRRQAQFRPDLFLFAEARNVIGYLLGRLPSDNGNPLDLRSLICPRYTESHQETY